MQTTIKMRNLHITFLLLAWVLSSCSSPEGLFNSQDITPDTNVTLRQYFYAHDAILSPGDKITISIWGHEDLSIGSVNSTFSSNEATGRWLTLDSDGEVNLPKLGRVKLSDLNLKEVNYLLEQRYSTYLKDPLVTVKVLNHYVTVFGEVNAPGKYAIDNERLYLLEVLAEAQGLTKYAAAKQAKVIRQNRGRAIELLIDLTSITAISEYNVVLQPDDVIYIPAGTDKTFDEKLQRATPIASIATGLAVIASIFLK